MEPPEGHSAKMSIYSWVFNAKNFRYGESRDGRVGWLVMGWLTRDPHLVLGVLIEN
jgi:hypothetical protein